MSSDFIRHALDHQIRLDVGKDYKLIREMIVAQAFEPVDNLEEVVGIPCFPLNSGVSKRKYNDHPRRKSYLTKLL